MKFITSCLKHSQNIIIDQEQPSSDSDISESGQHQAIPKFEPKKNKFRSIAPVGRVMPISKPPKRNVKIEQAIQISDSQEVIQQEPALEINQINEDLIELRAQYRPLRQRLIKAANKCKIERRQFSSTECSICLNSLQTKPDDEIGKLQCKHAFCFCCIFESSKFSSKCPYCRTPYNKIIKGCEYVAIQEQQLNEDEENDEPCYICGRNDDFDNLLECEYCEGAFCHTYCDSRLQSDIPPQGSWFCLSCSEIIENYERQQHD